MIRKPRLKYSVAFDKPAVTSDGAGGSEDGWVEQFATAADILFLRGSETVLAARLSGKQPVVLTVRAFGSSALIETSWRCRDVRSGVVYNIRAIVPRDDGLFYEITAESGVAS